MTADKSVLSFATQGAGSNDEQRIRRLLEPLSPHAFEFRRDRKLISALRLIRETCIRRPDIVVMEGTGIAGGLALLFLRLVARVPYIVSSGDAVGPFLASLSSWLRPAGALYERALCRFSAGYIGWSPYLVGRALTFGAPRAMTAPGWAETPDATEPVTVRTRLGIDPDKLVFGIVGSLAWNARIGYCYGLELVRAVRSIERRDVVVLIVGDGTGMRHLRDAAAGDPRVLFTGRVSRDEVPAHMATMDVASLPQSVDGVGAFRYTTKLSEYLAARAPVVTGEIPLAYDLDDGWLWRLPGDAPWDPTYVAALARLISNVSREDVARRAASISPSIPMFDAARQQGQVCAFVEDAVARGLNRPALERDSR